MGQVAEGEQTTVEAACEVLEGILAQGQLRATVESAEVDERVELTISGPDASVLVGKQGQTLDALQYIVNRIVSRRVGGHRGVLLDSDGYRERREASLVELAERLSEKALSEGRVVPLDPMNARERRVVHMALREKAGLSTRSEGEGETRRLLIVPEGADA